MLITTALKEWSVAVDALANGETMVLLRKGGIKEQQGKFVAQAKQVLLFPTFEHQQRELLKPDYQAAVHPVEPGWHPQAITLKAWAEITHVFLTDEADKVAALSAFHIWQPQLAQSRLKWKPQQPLYVLALRVYRLPEPVSVPWQSAYGGCRSWIELEAGVEVSAEVGAMEGEAAIATPQYLAQLNALKSALAA